MVGGGGGITGGSEWTAVSCRAKAKSQQHLLCDADIVNKENCMVTSVSLTILLCWFVHVQFMHALKRFSCCACDQSPFPNANWFN